MSTRFMKALVAALVLSGISLSVASTASAAPWSYKDAYMHARHDPANTNGF
jgi:hypothetical protein